MDSTGKTKTRTKQRNRNYPLRSLHLKLDNVCAFTFKIKCKAAQRFEPVAEALKHSLKKCYRDSLPILLAVAVMEHFLNITMFPNVLAT